MSQLHGYGSVQKAMPSVVPGRESADLFELHRPAGDGPEG